MTDLVMTVAVVVGVIAFLVGAFVATVVIGACAGWSALRAERKAARRVGELVVLLVLVASTASAEPTWKFPTPAGRKAAGIASWGTVGVLMAADTVSAFKADDPKRALMLEGTRLGVTYGAVWLAKTLVHRDRPCAPACGRDNPHASFFSGHTAGAFSAVGGMRLEFSLPLAIGTGGLRVAGDMHYFSDVVVGAAVGAAASKWIR